MSALAEVAALPLTDRVADIAAVRARFGGRAPALVETTLLRRKAATKLRRCRRVAVHRRGAAAGDRGPGGGRTGPGGWPGGRCTTSPARSAPNLPPCAGPPTVVVGSDIDPVRLAMARHNCAASVALCRADALHPVTRDAVVVADPARRSGGRRRFDPRDYTPALDAAARRLPRPRPRRKVRSRNRFRRDCARLGFDGEIEVTSCGGSVREACLWSPGLAQPGVTRRASVLDRVEEVTDADPDDVPGRPRRALDRRPRRRRGAGRAGAALRGPARAVAARPRHRLPVR